VELIDSFGRHAVFVLMASKTIPCRFFQTGVCRNGNNCNFSHNLTFPASAESRNERRPGPRASIREVSSTIKTLRAAELCHFYQEGRCMKGDKCPRRHQIPRSPNLPADVCQFFLAGKCTFGDTCRRSHPVDMVSAQTNSRPWQGSTVTQALDVHTLCPLN
jgi:CCCH-type zinc finger/Zinc finger C-x8-C-x5-C-x3-H type (and similar)/RNA-binding, Nab2-type zinc finger